MPVEAVTFLQPTATDSDRNPSPTIWADCPWEAIRTGFVPGAYIWDDFVSFNKTPATTEGNWAANQGYAQFASTTGTLTSGTGQGGEVVLGATEDDEGVGFRTLAVPFLLARTAKRFWFECRVKTSTVDNTKHDLFVGLLQNVALTATVPITATAGTLADTNFVGFHRLGTDGDAIDTVFKADTQTQVTVGTDAVTIAADTYVKLGIKYDPARNPFVHDPTGTAGRGLVTFYANGVKLADHYQITTTAGNPFPNDIGLGLCIMLINATGTAEGTSTMDWWKAAQEF